MRSLGALAVNPKLTVSFNWELRIGPEVLTDFLLFRLRGKNSTAHLWDFMNSP